MQANNKTKFSFILLLFCLSSLFSVQAQSRIKSLFEEDSVYMIPADDPILDQIRNMPNIEVGKGITFQPKDKWYKLTMRFRMQNMVGMSFNDHFSLDKTEAQVKRLRLRFDGYIYSPKLTYSIQLGFTPYDSKPVNGNMNFVRDAMVYYIPNATWNIGFGQTKIKANRARTNSSSALQFVDRSIVNSEFNIDRDFGFFGEYNTRLFNDFNIVARGSITSGDGRNFQSAEKSGFAYTGRLELFPLGRFKALGDVFEGDYERESTPKVLIAGGYSFNDRAKRLRGETGDLIADNQTRNLSNYYLDFILKYRGFAFYTDWMGRVCNDPYIRVGDDIEQTIYTGNGINVQTSYLFRSNWEIALRNSTLLPANEVKPSIGYQYFNQSTIGVTRYILGHNLKIQADASFNYKKGMPKSSYNPYEIRFQVELGF
ncbi:MAG: porin [Bacteroidales bacterium]